MIGVFDSGIGGLTVVRSLLQSLPGYDILYFGDTARTPYGSKSPETVVQYARENTEFLLSRGAKLVVMACNTASSVATEALSDAFDVPLFEVISPAVARSVAVTRKKRIGIIGTRATVGSGVYERKIRALDPDARVFSAACPLLVPLVEEGWVGKPETTMIVKKYLLPLKTRQIDTLILGCTHYPLLYEPIQRKIGKRVAIIDSSTSVAADVRAFLEKRPDIDRTLSRQDRIRLHVSDVTAQFEKTARRTLKKQLSLEQVRL
jgi:glutamate racemase